MGDGGADGGGADDVGAAEAAAAMDPSMGFGVPGVDPGVSDVAGDAGGGAATAADIGLTDADIAAANVGSTQAAPAPESFMTTPIVDVPEPLGFLSPTPASLAMNALGMAVPGIGMLASLGKAANALGATPGTDLDAYGAPIGEVGTTGGADAGFGIGGSQGSAGGGDTPQASALMAGLAPPTPADELFGVAKPGLMSEAPPNARDVPWQPPNIPGMTLTQPGGLNPWSTPYLWQWS